MSRPRKILLVDDDTAQLLVVAAWLRSEGHEVSTLNSPFGVGRAVLREQPDLVILDLNMPALSGTVVAEALRRHSKSQHTAIIFHSCTTKEALQEAARQHGALGGIQKTTDPRVFLDELRRILLMQPW